MEQKRTAPALSLQAFHRLPYYLQYLRQLAAGGATSVSAPTVAAHFGSTEIQVRKDFAAVCPTQGKPKHGFPLVALIASIEETLGCRNSNETVLVGAGSLGHALLSYSGFAAYGLRIVAAFDSDPARCGSRINDVLVLPAEKIADLCRRMRIRIGIITVPAAYAQSVCDALIRGGVLAIWNFAPIHLTVPDGVLVQNENMAASLALLSRHLQEREEAETPALKDER